MSETPSSAASASTPSSVSLSLSSLSESSSSLSSPTSKLSLSESPSEPVPRSPFFFAAAGRRLTRFAAPALPMSSSKSWSYASSSDPSSSNAGFSSFAAWRSPSPSPAAPNAVTSWLSQIFCLDRGAMSSMNSASFGSAAIIASSSRSAACFLAFFIFFSSRTPMKRSGSGGSGAFGSGAGALERACAEEPAECRDHGRGSAALLTALAYSTEILDVSTNVLLKYSSAFVASSSVLYPTNAIWRLFPSLVFMIFASVTSPRSAKCSRRRSRVRCLGMFFTHSREEGGAGSSSSPQ